MKILIKGAGDLATGIALRLKHCGYDIVMTDIAEPTTVRRTVAFSRCIYEHDAQIEDVIGTLCENLEQIDAALISDKIAVIIDPDCLILEKFKPDILIDAIIAKKNIGTSIDDAPIVIGIGPGFYAGKDVDCVVETKRGHTLGRCIWNGSAIANTGVPGNIGGYSKERIIRATKDGLWSSEKNIGDIVKSGDQVGEVSGVAVYAQFDGVIRGLLQDGVHVINHMKSGDIDPRCEVSNCYTVSDKALAIGGGVLEAILKQINSKK